MLSRDSFEARLWDVWTLLEYQHNSIGHRLVEDLHQQMDPGDKGSWSFLFRSCSSGGVSVHVPVCYRFLDRGSSTLYQSFGTE